MNRTGSFFWLSLAHAAGRIEAPTPWLLTRANEVSQGNRAWYFRVDTVGPLDACYPRNPRSKIPLFLHLKVLKGQPYERF
jgi:hypothetical protein